MQQPQIAVPRNGAELEAAQVRASELNRQLEAVTERRRELAQQIQTSDVTLRPALQARLKVLDDRSARLEGEILQAHDAIANALAGGVMVKPPPDPWTLLTQPRQPDPARVIAPVVLGEALAFVLLGLVLWRFAWKRAVARMRPGIDPSSRLDQLQNAVDSIAVEVERISENQRYVTKIFDERLHAIGAGEAPHIPGKQKNSVPVRASDDS